MTAPITDVEFAAFKMYLASPFFQGKAIHPKVAGMIARIEADQTRIKELEAALHLMVHDSRAISGDPIREQALIALQNAAKPA